MLQFISIGLYFVLMLSPQACVTIPGTPFASMVNPFITSPEDCMEIYCEAGLEGKLDYGIFQRAIDGVTSLPVSKQDILTIIDYSRPSSEKRFYVIDLANHRLVYQTQVAHGKNSGERSCTSFSNKPRSLKSSPGFFLTAETYNGRHGYSLRLDGMEPGINDQARARAIVIHGADYVCQEFVKEYGYIGRSFGCPALPLEVNKKIIDLIKGGSCLYIHTNDSSYISNSVVVDSIQ